ncbi:MAG TPA: hypothetical protein PKC75_18065 [Dysgonomonas sp.]|nr:hypothetical protein [Dysgonomonas sp. UBA7710]HMM04789.1 hypothetical protein [Dysgonomonas sp.]
MLKLNYQSEFSSYIRYMLLSSLFIKQEYFLPFKREFILPYTMPFGFGFPSAIAHSYIFMSPMMYFLSTAFCNNRCSTSWTHRIHKTGHSFRRFIVYQCETHININNY